eukprot:52082-Chlamydomonas_euryale.AAC.8
MLIELDSCGKGAGAGREGAPTAATTAAARTCQTRRRAAYPPAAFPAGPAGFEPAGACRVRGVHFSGGAGLILHLEARRASAQPRRHRAAAATATAVHASRRTSKVAIRQG